MKKTLSTMIMLAAVSSSAACGSQSPAPPQSAPSPSIVAGAPQNAESLLDCEWTVYQEGQYCVRNEVSATQTRLANNYWEDPTTQNGAQENVDRAIFLAGFSGTLTTHSALIVAARNSLGIPNTAINLTYEQDQAVSATADAIALNLAQSLTQPTITALGKSTDPIEQSVFNTLSFMAQTGWSPARNSGGGGYSGPNNQEKKVCAREPYDCHRVRNTPQYSSEWSERYYPRYHPHNTRRDAHRHCVWTALMTERANSGFAKRLGDAHEYGAEGQPVNERDMDLHNNYWGRDVGVRTEGSRDVTRADGCRDFINNGTLRWLR